MEALPSTDKLTGGGRIAYEPHIECGAVVGVMRNGPVTGRMECEFSGISREECLGL